MFKGKEERTGLAVSIQVPPLAYYMLWTITMIKCGTSHPLFLLPIHSSLSVYLNG
ncbi:uncharacterized protein BDW43DRAFT_293138 [Aspergillus alliaceus]|uniref:uncharacterized protein n=1 Tax=Petromyces alliaceus TaxID=209559 RepID=UPI0012A43A4C|nr:uncharacterized protein BDW43DRAFT_293138 [Aspergillus alliaceus]KAB8227817.1 hypothetical protein BDW43DRAFT_293138 [Aspergillus alliaceus]